MASEPKLELTARGRDRKEHFIGHRERLRRRFMKSGNDALPDYELLELLLTFAIPRRDVKPLAKKLLHRFGNLKGVLDAGPTPSPKLVV